MSGPHSISFGVPHFLSVELGVGGVTYVGWVCLALVSHVSRMNPLDSLRVHFLDEVDWG